MRGTILTGLMIVLISSGVQAGDADGGVAGAFLQVPIGARATALGGAYIAISDDGAAPLFNPAGISGLQRTMLSSSYRAMRLDRKIGYVTALFPVQGDAALGIHWLYAGSGTVGERDADGALTGDDFSFNNHQFSVTFGKRFEKYMSLGATISYLNSSFPHVNVAAVGFDFGAIFHVDQMISRERRDRMKVTDIRIGLTVRNLAKELNWNNEDYLFVNTTNTIGNIQDDNVPIQAGLGLSARFLQRKLVLATDLTKNADQAPVFHGGGEYFVTEKFALRAGYGDKHLAAGTGFLFSLGQQVMAVDYAFSADKAGEGSEHIFSFDLLF